MSLNARHRLHAKDTLQSMYIAKATIMSVCFTIILQASLGVMPNQSPKCGFPNSFEHRRQLGIMNVCGGRGGKGGGGASSCT